MCKASPSVSAGQADFPLFHVVLLDASGAEHGYIGYRFGEAGAQTAANGWNSQADRTLTAVIRDGLPPTKPVSDAGFPGTPEQRTLEAIRDLAQDCLPNDVDSDDHPARRLLVLTGTGKQFILPQFCPDDDIDFYRDVIRDAEQVDVVDDCATNAQEAPSNALDATSEQDDSDVEYEDESGTSDELAGSTFDDDDLNVRQTLFDMMDDAQRAADRGDLSLMTTLGLRYALVRYLQSVVGAIVDNKLRHTSDIGMLAKSLELFCARVIDGNEDSDTCEAFSDGQDGSIVNDYGTAEALHAWIENATVSAVPA